MTQPPILDHDPTRRAVIEPTMWHDPIDAMPAAAAITWMADAHAAVLAAHDHTQVLHFPIESSVIEVHRVEFPEGPVALSLAQVGAPISAILLETMIATGIRSCTTVGSAGGLVESLPPGAVVVPSSTIRDEGVSYHYADPSTDVAADPALQRALLDQLGDLGVPVSDGTVWTTDAFYRETPDRIARRVAAGAVAVDMECSALAAVAAFRGIPLGQAVYLADTLHGDRWDPTELVERDTDYRTRLLVAACRASITGG